MLTYSLPDVSYDEPCGYDPFKDFSHSGFVGMWLQTAAMNFPMALAWQIFFGGPFGRLVFRLIFRRQKNTVISEDAELAEETAE